VDTYTDPTGHHHVAVEKEDVIEYTCPDCGDSYTEEIIRDPVSLSNTLFTTAWGMDFTTSIEAKAPIAKGAKFHLYYNREVATFVSAVGSDKITIDTSVAGELTVKVLEDIPVGEKLMDLNFKTFEYLNTGSYTLLSVDENSKPLCEFTDLAIYQMGDVNMDGNINSRDVLMIKQSVVRMIELTGVQKMLADDIPCEDILTQLNAANGALHRISFMILDGHRRHCVREGIEKGNADETIESFAEALENFSKMA
jgi:DNA-binding FrmR family transcriptional regulator